MMKLAGRQVLFGSPQETDEEIQAMLNQMDAEAKQLAREERELAKEKREANRRPRHTKGAKVFNVG